MRDGRAGAQISGRTCGKPSNAAAARISCDGRRALPDGRPSCLAARWAGRATGQRRGGDHPARLLGRAGARLPSSALIAPGTSRPALIHGDMWGGNILCRDGRVAAFIDPAIYHAEPEIELAFATLFATFGTPFFERYRDIRPIAPGFFEERPALYNLYPLLVHVRLFGGHYVASVEATLSQLGC